MSIFELRSPRAAIQKWLSRTESTSHRPTADKKSRNVANDHPRTAYARQSRGGLTKRKRSHTRDTLLDINIHHPESCERLPKPDRESRTKLRLEDHSHHQNHVPDDDESQAGYGTGHRSRKRRLLSSSQSAILQPAATCDLIESNHRPEHKVANKFKDTDPAAIHRSYAKSLVSSSSTRLETLVAGKDQHPVNRYERQPRHKTREDHYELKADKQASKGSAARQRSPSRAKRRKQKEKSGTALIHDYKAPNVTHERLTLKQSTTSGLFGKGKASSPKRRPLPDLAFSELQFLNSRKDKLMTVEGKPGRQHSRKKARAAGDDAEISRYFAARKDFVKSPAQRRDDVDISRAKGLGLPRDAPPAFVQFSKPFLGFGSCGGSSTSPIKMIKQLDAKYVPSWSQRETRSPTGATSYLSWSQSSRQSQRLGTLRQHDHSNAIEPIRLVSTRPSCLQKSRSDVNGDAVSLREATHSTSDIRGAIPLRPRLREASRTAPMYLQSRGGSHRVLSEEKDAPLMHEMLSGRSIRQSDDVPKSRSSGLPRPKKRRSPNPAMTDDPEHHKATTDMGPQSRIPTQTHQEVATKPSSDTDLDALLEECNAAHDYSPRLAPQNLDEHEIGARSVWPAFGDLGGVSNVGLGAACQNANFHAPPSPESRGHPSEPKSRLLSSSHLDRGSEISEAPKTQQSAAVGTDEANHLVGEVREVGKAGIRMDNRNVWNGYSQLYDRQLQDQHSFPVTQANHENDVVVGSLDHDVPAPNDTCPSALQGHRDSRSLDDYSQTPRPRHFIPRAGPPTVPEMHDEHLDFNENSKRLLYDIDDSPQRLVDHPGIETSCFTTDTNKTMMIRDQGDSVHPSYLGSMNDLPAAPRTIPNGQLTSRISGDYYRIWANSRSIQQRRTPGSVSKAADGPPGFWTPNKLY